MKSDVMTEKIDFENMVGSELLEYISFKDEFPMRQKWHSMYSKLDINEIYCKKIRGLMF